MYFNEAEVTIVDKINVELVMKEFLPKSKTGKGFIYYFNQEKYMKAFLEDGYIYDDNNVAEGSIRSFCIEKHNWYLIDTIDRADAIIYSIAETAKANN